jgi:hypothetical protein
MGLGVFITAIAAVWHLKAPFFKRFLKPRASLTALSKTISDVLHPFVKTTPLPAATAVYNFVTKAAAEINAELVDRQRHADVTDLKEWEQIDVDITVNLSINDLSREMTAIVPFDTALATERGNVILGVEGQLGTLDRVQVESLADKVEALLSNTKKKKLGYEQYAGRHVLGFIVGRTVDDKTAVLAAARARGVAVAVQSSGRRAKILNRDVIPADL